MSDPTLGQVPSHWAVTSLGAVCKEGGGSVQTGPFGSQLHARDYVDFGIPSIMPLNIGDNRIIEDDIKRITNEDAVRLSKYRVRPGDIVYSRRGDVERHALVRSEQDGWLCGTGCLRVRFGDGDVVPEFASFYLDHPYVRQWIVRHAVGATMPNLNTKIMSAVPFVVPPKSEQKAIANILGTLDDKIELNRRMNETLESIARAIFKSWFVDFDPVRAKLEGQSHEQQSSASAYPMPAEVYDLFPSAFQDSELGKIPEGWSTGLISDVGVNNRRTVKPPEIGDDAAYIALDDMPRKSIALSEWEIGADIGSNKSGFRANEILFGKLRPYFHKVGVAALDGVCSTDILVISPCKSEQFGFLLGHLSSDEVIAFSDMVSTGTRMPRTNWKNLSTYPIALPSDGLMAHYDTLVRSIVGKIHANIFESKTLAQLRDTLLPKLLSGELTIPDALLQAEEAL